MAKTRTAPWDYQRRITKDQWEKSWQQFLEVKARLHPEMNITQECECEPFGDACPACVEYIKQHHGDEIPFEFGGQR